MKNTIYILLGFLLFSACSKEITLNLPDYDSKLVVNGELNTDQIIDFEVSRSLPIMQVTDSSGYLIKTATVQVFENGNLLGNANYFSGRYQLNYKPKAGQSYTIKVNAAGYPNAESQIKMANAFPMTVNYKDSIGLDDFGFKIGEIKLNFSDNINTEDYYKLLITYYNAATTVWFPFDINSNDIVFLNNDKLADGGYLFSDRTFSGKSKSLTFKVPFGLATGSPKFVVSLKQFSAEYNDYLQAIDQYRQNGNGTSNDPIILKSNVNGGIGMIGAVINKKDTIL